jgi:hypothetical protein
MSTKIKLTSLLAALACASFALACTPKETTSASDAGSAASSTAAASASSGAAASAVAAASAAPATLANDPLPTHGDVAKKVRDEITKANYKTELDKIEKEAD